MNPLEQLDQIPDLAVEAWITRDAKNPGARAGRGGGKKAGTPSVHTVPCDLAVYDALRPDPDALGKSLRGLLMQCVWAVHDETPGPDLPEQTFTELCRWLTRTADHWNEGTHAAKAADCETCREEGGSAGFIIHTIHRVWSELASLCRVERERRLKCTRLGCGARARFQPGGRWLVCDNGHTLDAEAERGRFLTMQDWTLTETRSNLLAYLGRDVPLNTLKTWAKRGKIRPIDDNQHPKRYNFGAVCRMLDSKAG